MAGPFGSQSSSLATKFVTNTPAVDLALTNLTYCSPSDLQNFAVSDSKLFLALVGDSFVLLLSPHETIRNGYIALNAIQRRLLRASIGDTISVTRFVPPHDFTLALLKVELEFVKKGTKSEQVDATLLANQLRKRFDNQVMTAGQRVAFEYHGNKYIFTVNQAVVEGQEKSNTIERGMISSDTYIVFDAPNESGIKIVNQCEAASSNICRQKEFNLQLLGIGGLSAKFVDTFQTAFAPHVFPPRVTSKLGTKHVKDMLLFEPPASGASTDDLERYRPNGKVDCGDRHNFIYQRAMLRVEQVKFGKGSPLVTCMLEGPSGSGKTALAATIGIDCDFPYVNIISAESLIGFDESTKCAQIVKVFEDAYKSPLSIIILDDIERLLDYVAIGPHFSNKISQTLLIVLKRLPPKGKKLLVIGTTSEVSFLISIGICNAFSVTYHVPTLKTEDAKKVLEQENVFAEEDVSAAAEALNDVILILIVIFIVVLFLIASMFPPVFFFLDL